MNPQIEKESELKDRNIQKMATLLRDGNTLLSESCPQCNSPLFKLKSGEIYCASCDKKVVVIKDDDEINEIMQNKILDDATKVINMKIKDLQQKIDLEKDVEELYKMTRLFLIYLESLEKLKNLKKN